MEMPSNLAKRCHEIGSIHFVMTGPQSFFIDELRHLTNLNFDYPVLYGFWNPVKGDKKDTFKALTELVYNDIFIVHALVSGWNLRNAVQNPRKEKVPERALRFDITPPSNAIEFIYHMRYATIMTRSQYDKLLLLIFAQLGTSSKGKRFNGKIEYLKNNLNAEQKIPGIEKILDDLCSTVKCLNEIRDPILHTHERKFDIYQIDGGDNVYNFTEYFELINKRVNQFQIFLIQYLELISRRKFCDFKLTDFSTYIKKK